MDRILFVNPKSKNVSLTYVPPLVLGTLASYVKKMHPSIEIRLIDETIGQHFSKKVIDDFSPDLIAVTSMTEFSYRAYEIAEIAKRCGIKSVGGGKHPTIFPEEAAKHFDMVVVGDGEIALSKIIEGNTPAKGIIIGEPLVNLDDIPPMPWELFDLDRYITAHLKNVYSRKLFPNKKRVGNIHTDRGCPYSCIYCYNSTHEFKKIRYHSPDRVIYELKYLVDNYKVDHVHFLDDNLMVKKERLSEICRKIKDYRLGITWSCAASTTTLLPHHDLLPIMKDAGCSTISLGLESQSERILAMIKGKAFSPDKNIQAVRLCKQYGFIVQGDFLIGIPTETESDLMETVNYIMKKEVDFISVQIVKPYPGTRLWHICKDMGLIPDNLRWDGFFEQSFHEKFSYDYLSKILIDCHNEYVPFSYKRLLISAIQNPGDTIKALLYRRKEIWHIIKKLLKIG